MSINNLRAEQDLYQVDIITCKDLTSEEIGTALPSVLHGNVMPLKCAAVTSSSGATPGPANGEEPAGPCAGPANSEEPVGPCAGPADSEEGNMPTADEDGPAECVEPDSRLTPWNPRSVVIGRVGGAGCFKSQTEGGAEAGAGTTVEFQGQGRRGR